MKGVRSAALALTMFLCSVYVAHAQIVITEIMYDPSGSDVGAEWIEIYNASNSPIDLTKWKVNDGTNHVLNPPPKNGGHGSLLLGANAYLILAADAASFR